MLKVGRIWRILATGFCFLMFTSGSLCLSCGFLPLLCLVISRSCVGVLASSCRSSSDS